MTKVHSSRATQVNSGLRLVVSDLRPANDRELEQHDEVSGELMDRRS